MFAVISPYNSIFQLLHERNIPFKVIDWEQGIGEERVMEENGFVLHQGAKSMVLKTDDGFLLVVLAGDKRLDLRKVKDFFEIGRARLATNDEIKALMGCEIGACYPIGELIGLKTYVDSTLADNEEIFFNPGVFDKWFLMSWENFVRLTSPEIIAVAK